MGREEWMPPQEAAAAWLVEMLSPQSLSARLTLLPHQIFLVSLEALSLLLHSLSFF